jgi:hypothetical protein
MLVAAVGMGLGAASAVYLSGSAVGSHQGCPFLVQAVHETDPFVGYYQTYTYTDCALGYIFTGRNYNSGYIYY